MPQPDHSPPVSVETARGAFRVTDDGGRHRLGKSVQMAAASRPAPVRLGQRPPRETLP